MKRIGIIIIAVAVGIVTVWLTKKSPGRGAGQTHTSAAPQTETAPPERQVMTNGAYPGRTPASLGDVFTDAEDPEFAQRVLPGIRQFFATLGLAGVNPLKDENLSFSRIKITYVPADAPNGIICRFIINTNWVGTYLAAPDFSGMMHFGQRGPDNPYSAISHANTNALIRLSQKAIKMSEAEAERTINHISDAFAVDRSKFEKPEIFPEKMFEYDLGMYAAAYRKKGSNPVNQMNYTLEFSIRATSPTSAVLVMYSEAPPGKR